QEAAIPAVENVRYYLRVDGFKGIGQDSQLVKLKASILPFQIRSVQSAKGGNTGYATVLLKGGKFSPQMQIFLQRDTLLIPADSLGFVDGTKAFARFNLLNQPLGLYTVRGLHPLGDTASWHYYEIEPGGPPDVVTFLRHPVSVTTRRRGPTTGVVPQLMTLDFENRGNTDIPIPYQPVRSVGGAPLSFSSGDLIGSQATELQVPLLELEGPQAYLRAGAKGSMVIWVNWAGKPMFFAVEKIK
ncbi:MAG: hypothetical protein ABIQ93_06590, partial [Saprospiraceae bacterium]